MIVFVLIAILLITVFLVFPKSFLFVVQAILESLDAIIDMLAS